MVSDSEAALAISEAEVQAHRRLVLEALALFGGHHYAHYDFLLTLSDGVAHFGLEHHQSSDDRVAERVFLDEDLRSRHAGLLPHEMVHSWNGKYRRPAGLALGLRSFAVALTNPKALLFMSAFLPQFINPAAPLLAQYAVLASVMALMNVAVMLAYATLGAQMVRAFQGAGLRWLNRVCGGLLIGLAGTLALYRRSTPLS